MIHLVFYDIENNKLRTKLAKRLEAKGMERIQYSIFAAKLDARRWKMCWLMIENTVKDHLQPTDKIYYLEISEQAFCNMKCIGQQVDTFYIADKLNVLFI